MKILLVNYSDAGGGSSIACFRLMQSLIQRGVYVRFAVVEKKTTSPFVVEIPRVKKSKFLLYLKRLLNLIFRVFRKILPCIAHLFDFESTNGLAHSTNKESLVDVNWINGFDCDVVNLHWVAANMLSIKDIAKIKRPIVWTTHDSWPFCGAEHHPNVLENDNRYTQVYTRKNKPKTTKGPDICRGTWLQKRKYLSKKNIVFISPSNWERECLEHSSLFHGHRCFTIPNIIPKSIFKPLDKKTIRNILGVPKGKKIIGFGASFDINNPRGIKGSFYLLEALQKLKNKDDYFFLVFGDVNAAFASRLPLPYFSAGFITNEKILSLLYNALDVFICPSIVESLSLTVLEALFSGVPSVAFDVGGVVDIIEHKKTGYLAKPYDTDDLASGIEWCLSKRSKLSKECLKKAAADFDEDQIVTKHIEVYDFALRESRS